jgi:hypothetical protein
MNRFVVTEGIENVLSAQVRIPTIVMWNRLEGRPRRPDFSRALKAEVRDPLWMLTRQWQMGEFIGEDAGSPVTAKVAWKTDQITEVHGLAGEVQPYDPNFPLEVLIEARPVAFTSAGRLHNADLRLMLGRRWKQLLVSEGHGARVPDFKTTYSFTAPDPAVANDFPLTSHAATWQTLAAIADRAIDGGQLLEHLRDGGVASDGLGLVDPEKSAIDTLGATFLAWAQRLYFQPQPNMQHWKPGHLEYEAGLSAPHGEQLAALSASEYHGGRLDWFNFDAVPPGEHDAPGTSPPAQVTSFMPTTIQFEGMPNTRHWTFEEGVTNFGNIDPDTTDLAKLLLIEFGLVFANDWFMLPIDLPLGSLTDIVGLAVTNVFDERFWIEPAVTAGDPVQSWRMFRLTPKGAADDRLFLPATTQAALESAPVESVTCLRDEVSNMVWGIETVVQLADGLSRPGREVALELHAKYQAAVPTPAPPAEENDAKIKYSLMTSVPEHWIPFIPVHIEGNNREIQLQRAAMPRLLEGLTGVVPEKIAPRTQLLREGLDAVPAVSYYVAEEEVPRAGTVLEASWQRCRWRGGRVITWLGYQRTLGRGEGSSGLAFDIVLPKQPKTTS